MESREQNQSQGRREPSERQLTLKSLGITLSALVLSIGVTVGFGVKADLWVKVLSGAGTTAALAMLIRLGSGERGILTRLARWITRA